MSRTLEDSSITFWWRRWHEQSRTPAAHAWPWPSAISCTSMWCALPTIASMKTVPSPNESWASRRLLVSAVSSSLSSATLRMPRPPPPAAALIISGKPIRSACSRASSIVSTGPLLHGATGTPAFSAISLDWILSPSARMTSPLGPTNTSPISSIMSANAGCSATKPQPGQTASASVAISACLRPS